MSATDNLAKILRDTVTNDVVSRIKAIQKDGGTLDDLLVDVTAETVVDGMIEQIRAVASQFLEAVYVLIEYDYEYNDEHYYTPEGDPYYALRAFGTEAEAQATADAMNQSRWAHEAAANYWPSMDYCEEGETIAQMSTRIGNTGHAPVFNGVVQLASP